MPSGKFFNRTEEALEPDVPRPVRVAGIDRRPEGLVRDAIGYRLRHPRTPSCCRAFAV